MSEKKKITISIRFLLCSTIWSIIKHTTNAMRGKTTTERSLLLSWNMRIKKSSIQLKIFQSLAVTSIKFLNTVYDILL